MQTEPHQQDAGLPTTASARNPPALAALTNAGAQMNIEYRSLLNQRFYYWWLTQNTAVPTTRIIRNKMAQASTVLSGLRALVELLIASPLVGFIGDCTKTRPQ
ncbi:hypothetical protein [Pseudomonas paralactis]|uniref:hypothetical protein n=1 Tax=Pseudomonas paralactis TaxID=1615673 RepID=UPI001428C47D|nr:hypothetical protein [Pseudomonas paralactis]